MFTKNILITAIFLMTSLGVQAVTFGTTERDRDGLQLKLTAAEASTFCRQKGQRLPTEKYFSSLLTSSGAKTKSELVALLNRIDNLNSSGVADNWLLTSTKFTDYRNENEVGFIGCTGINCDSNLYFSLNKFSFLCVR